MANDNLPVRYGESQQLALDFLGTARQTLEGLREPEDLALFLQKAQALAYLIEKAKLAEEVQHEAHEIVLRTRRKIGELGAPGPQERSTKGQFGPSRGPRDGLTAGERSAVLSRREISDARKVAAVPEEAFERYVEEAPKPSTHGLLKTMSEPEMSKPEIPEGPDKATWVMLGRLWPRIKERAEVGNRSPSKWLERIVEANLAVPAKSTRPEDDLTGLSGAALAKAARERAARREVERRGR